MRRIISLFIVLMLAFATVSYAETIDLKQYSVDQLNQLKTDIINELTGRTATDDDVSGMLGVYNVTIKGMKFDKDYQGNDCVIITVEWTNPSDNPTSYRMAFHGTAYQGGIEQNFAVLSGGNTTLDTKIKSGASYEVQDVFLITNKSAPIEFIIKELFNWQDNSQIVKVFTP